MVLPLQVDAPLREEADGALRVGDSRVLLEFVIRAFQDGATPETIVQRYDTLVLADVYAVVAYYLQHPAEVEKYMDAREETADDLRKRIETGQADLSSIRSRIAARRGA